jgi:hypothetical protein
MRLLRMPLLPEWDGKLTLRVTSPSYPLGKAGLAEALAQLGLLRDGAEGRPKRTDPCACQPGRRFALTLLERALP